MWALLMQLGELLPHLSRLVPMLERMLSRQSPDREQFVAHQAAQLRQSSDSLAEAQQLALRQLADHSAQIATLQGEIKLLSQAAARSEETLTLIEARIAALQVWLRTVSIAALLLLALIVFLLLRSATR
ncbi:MAG: hypothetical protein ACYCSN_18635 [Acidobacteriaceae bacterium]